MNVYEGVYFNDFIKSNLTNGILKRVIMNGMSGSSWRFKRFYIHCTTANRRLSVHVIQKCKQHARILAGKKNQKSIQ